MDLLYDDMLQSPGKSVENKSDRRRSMEAMDEQSMDIYGDLSMDSSSVKMKPPSGRTPTSQMEVKKPDVADTSSVSLDLYTDMLEKDAKEKADQRPLSKPDVADTSSMSLDLYTDMLVADTKQKTDRVQLKKAHAAYKKSVESDRSSTNYLVLEAARKTYQLQTRLKELEEKCAKLEEENKTLQNRHSQMLKNMSCLFLTAQRELKKKDEELNSLRQSIKTQPAVNVPKPKDVDKSTAQTTQQTTKGSYRTGPDERDRRRDKDRDPKGRSESRYGTSSRQNTERDSKTDHKSSSSDYDRHKRSSKERHDDRKSKERHDDYRTSRERKDGSEPKSSLKSPERDRRGRSSKERDEKDGSLSSQRKGESRKHTSTSERDRDLKIGSDDGQKSTSHSSKAEKGSDKEDRQKDEKEVPASIKGFDLREKLLKRKREEDVDTQVSHKQDETLNSNLNAKQDEKQGSSDTVSEPEGRIVKRIKPNLVSNNVSIESKLALTSHQSSISKSSLSSKSSLVDRKVNDVQQTASLCTVGGTERKSFETVEDFSRKEIKPTSGKDNDRPSGSTTENRNKLELDSETNTPEILEQPVDDKTVILKPQEDSNSVQFSSQTLNENRNNHYHGPTTKESDVGVVITETEISASKPKEVKDNKETKTNGEKNRRNLETSLAADQISVNGDVGLKVKSAEIVNIPVEANKRIEQIIQTKSTDPVNNDFEFKEKNVEATAFGKEKNEKEIKQNINAGFAEDAVPGNCDSDVRLQENSVEVKTFAPEANKEKLGENTEADYAQDMFSNKDVGISGDKNSVNSDAISKEDKLEAETIAQEADDKSKMSSVATKSVEKNENTKQIGTDVIRMNESALIKKDAIMAYVSDSQDTDALESPLKTFKMFPTQLASLKKSSESSPLRARSQTSSLIIPSEPILSPSSSTVMSNVQLPFVTLLSGPGGANSISSMSHTLPFEAGNTSSKSSVSNTLSKDMNVLSTEKTEEQNVDGKENSSFTETERAFPISTLVEKKGTPATTAVGQQNSASTQDRKQEEEMEVNIGSEDSPEAICTPVKHSSDSSKSTESSSKDAEVVTYIECASNLIMLGDEEATSSIFPSPYKPPPRASDFYPPGVRGLGNTHSATHHRHIRGPIEIIEKVVRKSGSGSNSEESVDTPVRKSKAKTRLSFERKDKDGSESLESESESEQEQDFDREVDSEDVFDVGESSSERTDADSDEELSECSELSEADSEEIPDLSIDQASWISIVEKHFQEGLKKAYDVFKKEMALKAKSSKRRLKTAFKKSDLVSSIKKVKKSVSSKLQESLSKSRKSKSEMYVSQGKQVRKRAEILRKQKSDNDIHDQTSSDSADDEMVDELEESLRKTYTTKRQSAKKDLKSRYDSPEIEDSNGSRESDKRWTEEGSGTESKDSERDECNGKSESNNKSQESKTKSKKEKKQLRKSFGPLSRMSPDSHAVTSSDVSQAATSFSQNQITHKAELCSQTIQEPDSTSDVKLFLQQAVTSKPSSSVNQSDDGAVQMKGKDKDLPLSLNKESLSSSDKLTEVDAEVGDRSTKDKVVSRTESKETLLSDKNTSSKMVTDKDIPLHTDTGSTERNDKSSVLLSKSKLDEGTEPKTPPKASTSLLLNVRSPLADIPQQIASPVKESEIYDASVSSPVRPGQGKSFSFQSKSKRKEKETNGKCVSRKSSTGSTEMTMDENSILPSSHSHKFTEPEPKSSSLETNNVMALKKDGNSLLGSHLSNEKSNQSFLKCTEASETNHSSSVFSMEEISMTSVSLSEFDADVKSGKDHQVTPTSAKVEVPTRAFSQFSKPEKTEKVKSKIEKLDKKKSRKSTEAKSSKKLVENMKEPKKFEQERKETKNMSENERKQKLLESKDKAECKDSTVAKASTSKSNKEVVQDKVPDHLLETPDAESEMAHKRDEQSPEKSQLTQKSVLTPGSSGAKSKLHPKTSRQMSVQELRETKLVKPQREMPDPALDDSGNNENLNVHDDQLDPQKRKRRTLSNAEKQFVQNVKKVTKNLNSVFEEYCSSDDCKSPFIQVTDTIRSPQYWSVVSDNEVLPSTSVEKEREKKSETESEGKSDKVKSIENKNRTDFTKKGSEAKESTITNAKHNNASNKKPVIKDMAVIEDSANRDGIQSKASTKEKRDEGKKESGNRTDFTKKTSETKESTVSNANHGNASNKKPVIKDMAVIEDSANREGIQSKASTKEKRDEGKKESGTKEEEEEIQPSSTNSAVEIFDVFDIHASTSLELLTASDDGLENEFGRRETNKSKKNSGTKSKSLPKVSGGKGVRNSDMKDKKVSHASVLDKEESSGVSGSDDGSDDSEMNTQSQSGAEKSNKVRECSELQGEECSSDEESERNVNGSDDGEAASSDEGAVSSDDDDEGEVATTGAEEQVEGSDVEDGEILDESNQDLSLDKGAPRSAPAEFRIPKLKPGQKGRLDAGGRDTQRASGNGRSPRLNGRQKNRGRQREKQKEKRTNPAEPWSPKRRSLERDDFGGHSHGSNRRMSRAEMDHARSRPGNVRSRLGVSDRGRDRNGGRSESGQRDDRPGSRGKNNPSRPFQNDSRPRPERRDQSPQSSKKYLSAYSEERRRNNSLERRDGNPSSSNSQHKSDIFRKRNRSIESESSSRFKRSKAENGRPVTPTKKSISKPKEKSNNFQDRTASSQSQRDKHRSRETNETSSRQERGRSRSRDVSKQQKDRGKPNVSSTEKSIPKDKWKN